MDRALTRAEMAELRSISTRAVITSTSFTNHYEWGDLKANPLKLLEKYFDTFVYVADWGTREFYLRFPLELVDYKQLRTMLPGDAASVRKAGSCVIVGFENESEQDDWDDGTGWMGSLMSLRSELLRGDLRCLYLGWLLCVQLMEFAGEEPEPPVPAGLGELSAPLHSLIEFLGIDEELVEVAALTSTPLNTGPSRKDLDVWIRSLPEKEKSDLLVTAASQSGDRSRNDLLRRFRQQNEPRDSRECRQVQRRTARGLMATAHARAGDRTRLLDAKRAAEAERQKTKDMADRGRYLDQLENRKEAAWKQISAHIQKRQPNEFDKAVSVLVDLRDLAARQGRESVFQSALERLRQTHAAKESFLRRLAKA